MKAFSRSPPLYAVFAARRAYDFIAMAIAEENLNVKIVCALPGLTTGYGPSHQATEDIAIFRGLPNMTILDPCDAHEIEQIVPAIAAYPGPVYMRLLRGNVPLILDEYDYKFELGKAKLLRDGKDAIIISSGFMTMRALEAIETLKADRVDVGVLHVPTIKPLDEAAILREAGRSGRLVVVAENHTIMGGLGEAIGALLLRSGVTPVFRQVALPDEFLDAGALPTLHERYGISAKRSRPPDQAVAGSLRTACCSWRVRGPSSQDEGPAIRRDLSRKSGDEMFKNRDMKTTRRLLLSACASLPLFAIATRRAWAAEFNYKLATGQDPTHPVNVRAQEAIDRIREATGGRLEIKLFPANQLGSDTDLLTQVRNGSVEFLNQSSSILATFVPVVGIVNTGFAFTNYDAVWQAMDGDLGTTSEPKSGRRRSLRYRRFGTTDSVISRHPPGRSERRMT